ncbi:MAG: hypothetical protein ACOVKC_06840 [Brevundimonas sp.]
MTDITHYQSSKGPIPIASIAGPHLRNAIRHLHANRIDDSRDAEINAMQVRLDELDAEFAATSGAAPPPPPPPPASAPAPIGDNNPPILTGFEAYEVHIGDLLAEAQYFLNGDGIQTDVEAEAVAKLRDMIRDASRDAEAGRVAEKKPHDDAAKAVQAKWVPLLAKATLATDVCKKALTPYLARKESEREAAAEIARADAAKKLADARDAIQAANANANLDGRIEAEALVKEAVKAEKVAAKVEVAKVSVAGGARATALRSYWTPTLVDRRAALVHYIAERPEAFEKFLLDQAVLDVREGRRQIPGFEITEERRVA